MEVDTSHTSDAMGSGGMGGSGGSKCVFSGLGRVDVMALAVRQTDTFLFHRVSDLILVESTCTAGKRVVYEGGVW